MKYFLLFLGWMTLGMSFTGYSQDERSVSPLLVKSNFPGYVPEDYWFEETCKLFKDKVDIEYRVSGQIIRESRRISGTSMIQKLLKKAQQETLSESPNMICDGPSTSIYGLEKISSGERKILLYETGGCGSPKQVREGGAAFILSTLIGKYCSVTH